MRIIKLTAASAFLSFCYLQIFAQTANVGNVWAEAQNRHIAVHYTLTTGQPADVILQYSTDNGRTWFDCKSVTGDLQSQTTGSKTIIWDCRQDGFEKGSLLFNVIANEQLKAIPKEPQPPQIEPSVSPPVKTYKKNVFGVNLGIGITNIKGNYEYINKEGTEKGLGLDLGVRYIHNFSPYIGWDAINLKLQGYTGKMEYIDEGLLFQAMTGLRVYTPNFAKNEKGYASLKGGIGSLLIYSDAFGFAYELEVGVHLTKTFSISLTYNHQNLEREYDNYSNNFSWAYIGLHAGFNF